MIGASLVKSYMDSKVCFKTGLWGEDLDVTTAVDQDWC